MSEAPGDREPQPDAVPQVYPWLRAMPEDLANLDFEAPIAGSKGADAGDLADLYRAASNALSSVDDDNSDVRIWNMLWGLTGLHFKPADLNEPFGPMLVLTGGGRSAIPSDFRGHIDMLETMARAASHVVLKARLNDLVWLLDRKRSQFGSTAVQAYLETVRLGDSGDLDFRYAPENVRFHHKTYEYLLRALGIARTLGWKTPESDDVQKMILDFRKRTVEARDPVPAQWFSSLDLHGRISEPGDVAVDVEAVLAGLAPGTDYHVAVEMWRLAARAYRLAKRDNDMYRCQISAAETMVAAADKTTSAMLASQTIGNAIVALHGVPGTKEKRIALRHRLIDVQAGISDEMTTFSQEIDLSELVERVRKKVTPLSLVDGLFVFAALNASPDPSQLQAEAEEAIRDNPLSSLFGAARIDSEGKVIHRTSGRAGFGDADAPAIRHQIAQAERNRRYLVASGTIEPARHIMTTQHYISDDVLAALLQHSPFVPSDLTQTFARGFSRFFQGDFTSALYILTPLLENSLRHVLKTRGHDVTTFDNATQTQEDRAISSIFEQMREELDAVFTRPITEDIDRVFLDKLGPYLRHAVAHGLLYDGSPYGTDAIYGCWLIFRLCLIPLFPHREKLGLL